MERSNSCSIEAEEKEIERQFEQQLLRVRNRKEQILARHHSTNTDFKIRSAIHEDEQEKLKAQEKLCAKCQEQSGKVQFSNAGLGQVSAKDANTYNATQNYETVVNEMKAGTNKDITLVLNNYKKVKMI